MAFFPGLLFLAVLLWVGYLGERVVRSSGTSELTPAVMLVAFVGLFLVLLGLLYNAVALILGLVALVGRRNQRSLAILGVAISVSVLAVAHFQDVVWTPLTDSESPAAPRFTTPENYRVTTSHPSNLEGALITQVPGCGAGAKLPSP